MTSPYAFGSYDGPQEDVVLVKSQDGQAGFLPRRARALTPEIRDRLARLNRLSLEIELAEREREELLPALRDAGVSWSLLAWAMDLSEKGVKYRLGQDGGRD